MNYSDNGCDCRVDFFKPSGKWNATLSVSFNGLWDEPLIHDAFKKALLRHFEEHYDGRTPFQGMRAICLEPYHEHEHPISLDIPEDLEVQHDEAPICNWTLGQETRTESTEHPDKIRRPPEGSEEFPLSPGCL